MSGLHIPFHFHFENSVRPQFPVGRTDHFILIWGCWAKGGGGGYPSWHSPQINSHSLFNSLLYWSMFSRGFPGCRRSSPDKSLFSFPVISSFVSTPFQTQHVSTPWSMEEHTNYQPMHSYRCTFWVVWGVWEYHWYQVRYISVITVWTNDRKPKGSPIFFFQTLPLPTTKAPPLPKVLLPMHLGRIHPLSSLLKACIVCCASATCGCSHRTIHDFQIKVSLLFFFWISPDFFLIRVPLYPWLTFFPLQVFSHARSTQTATRWGSGTTICDQFCPQRRQCSTMYRVPQPANGDLPPDTQSLERVFHKPVLIWTVHLVTGNSNAFFCPRVFFSA